MVKVKLGARAYDTQGEEDQSRWLLIADYGVERRQDAAAESCSTKIVREGPSMDQVRRAIREEYDRRMKVLQLEFALKAEELEKEFDMRRTMIIEAHLQAKEEDFKKEDESESIKKDFSEAGGFHVENQEFCGGSVSEMCLSRKGLGHWQAGWFPEKRLKIGFTFSGQQFGSRQDLNHPQSVKIRRWIFSWKRVRKKCHHLTSLNGQLFRKQAGRLAKLTGRVAGCRRCLHLLVNPVQILHRMLRAGVLAPMDCTQEVASLHTSRQPDPSKQNQNKHSLVHKI
ncbi:uncharacterized protein LOC120430961 [Culex pipiens pallens]|uniref:uncharacterized protein LOC120430961 n=1 Tax=Culex pipiens pallens TaxID=42434 RepID=UPI0019548DD7|nr:uncharacterized protein LOC120430961 [Culex pipiens pallens]